MYIPDIANGSGCTLIGQAGLPVPDKKEIDKSIGLGINVVKGIMKVPGTNNRTRLFIAPDLESQVSGVPGIIEEFELYHKPTDINGKVIDGADPVDETNHYLDPLRYWAVWYFAKKRLSMGNEPTQQDIKKKRENNLPSNQDILVQQNIPFIDNRESFGKKDDDDDGGNDGSPPSGPIFTWT
jgi:hypothetical protein